MDYTNYTKTALEDWITILYKRLGIVHPDQIDSREIARIMRIFIHFKERPSCHEVVGRYKGIIIDSREPEDRQREMFFHELCHLLRHIGVQSMLPDAFRELQERDARHFTRYACIPHHMLMFVDFDREDVIEQMISLFKVPRELCVERLIRIRQRIAFEKHAKYSFVCESGHYPYTTEERWND